MLFESDSSKRVIRKILIVFGTRPEAIKMAPVIKVVLVMREVTERPEAVNAGTVKLVGTDKNRIVSEADELLNNAIAYNTMSIAHNPYGDGEASGRIVAQLVALQACQRYDMTKQVFSLRNG